MPAELPWRLPSTRISVYFSGRPRSLILDCGPVAAVPPVTPGMLDSSSPMLVTGFFSMSSRVMTLMLAGASLMSMAWPEAVTTTVCRAWVWAWPAAGAWAWAWATRRDRRPGARARLRVRFRELTVPRWNGFARTDVRANESYSQRG